MIFHYSYVCRQLSHEARIAAKATYTTNEFSMTDLDRLYDFAARVPSKITSDIKKLQVHQSVFQGEDMVWLYYVRV